MRNLKELKTFSDSSSSILRVFKLKGKFISDDADQMYCIIWNKGKSLSMEVDGVALNLRSDHIITLTPTHHFSIPKPHKDVLILQFNEGFYCVDKHDKEVSCIGLIFYGSSNIITISLSVPERRKLHLLFDTLLEEFQNKDNIQREMLTVLLKRLIITCTRLAKMQHYGNVSEDSQRQLIRQFNILLEMHFRQEHNVQFYAKKLNRSPKTLTNLFALAKLQSPMKAIHARLLVEARRQLLFSEKSIKEIGYELNFSDIQTFSRFFKLKAGLSPSELRKRKNA